MDLSHQPQASFRTGQKRLFLFGGVGLLVVAVVLFTYFGTEIRANEPKASKAPPLVPVTMVSAAVQSIPFRLQAIGNVEALSTVSVKARVDGQILEVNFKEGEEIKKGSVLFKIDPRPYEAALRQAEATNARDVAARDQAQAQERRYKDLLEKNFVSKDAYAQFRTNADTAAAVADASKAAVDSARLNLEYCTIRTPIDGYSGKIQIQLGNLVKASDTNPLVVLNQVHPIYVSFAVPEQTLPAIRSYMSAGPLTVDASPPNSTKTAASGRLIFVDNAVDPTTGTIKLRGQFANKENSLWPGQFVNVGITLYDQRDAVVIPSQAIQNGPNGEYVFVVKPDMTAEMRKIKSDRAEGDNVIIASGLKGGEQVVTRGQLKLTPGARVKPES
jgi:membrane fusion protein, multidrug efflux system